MGGFQLNNVNGICVTIHTHKERNALVQWLNQRGIRGMEIPQTNGAQNKYLVLKCYVKPFFCIMATNQIHDCHMCENIYQFIILARTLRQMSLTEDYNIISHCQIQQLPKFIRNLAVYRLRQDRQGEIDMSVINTSMVDEFIWRETKEGWDFWYDIYNGKHPRNLNMRLMLFDIELYGNN